MVLDRLGRTREAIAEYQLALSLNPKLPDVLNNLAWILATRPDAEVRNGGQAVRLAEQACLLTGYRNVMIVGTLGAAYAEAGRFEEAMATARKVEALALADGNKELAEKNHKLAELFRSRQPFREPDNSATGVPTPTVPQTPSQ
jgi:Flp pilus assembly protein TadD